MRQSPSRWIATAALAALLLTAPGMARAGKLSWLDDVVKEVVREAEAGGKAVARGSDEAIQAGKAGGRLFVREAADEGLDVVARRAEGLARAGTKAVEEPSEALLKSRFSRLVSGSDEMARTFAGAGAGREAAGRRDGRDGPSAGPPLPRPGRADDPRAGHRRPGRRPRLRRRRGRDARQGGRRSAWACSARRAGAAGGSSTTRSCRTRASSPPRACWASTWPIRTSSLTRPGGRRSTRSSSSPGRASRSPAPSATQPSAAWAARSARCSPRGASRSRWRSVVGIGLATLVIGASLLVLLGAPIRWMFRPFGWAMRLFGIGKRPASALR